MSVRQRQTTNLLKRYQWLPVKAWIVLAAVVFLGLAAAIRWFAAGDFLWLDEQHTAWTVSGPISDVAARSSDGNQLPLFFYATWGVVHCLGTSEFSLRLVSLISSVLTIVVAAWWIYRSTRSGLAVVLVSVFFTFDFDSIYYASEARPYAMAQLLGLLQGIVFFRWLNQQFRLALPSKTNAWVPQRHALVMVVALSAMMFYTHCTSAGLWIAELLFLMVVCIAKRSWPRREIWIAAAALLIAIFPAIFSLAAVWQRRTNWQSISDPAGLLRTISISLAVMIGLPVGLAGVDQWLAKIRPGNRKAAKTAQSPSSPLPTSPEPTSPLPTSPEQTSMLQTQLWLGVFLACWAVIPPLSFILIDVMGFASLGLGRYVFVSSVALPMFAAFTLSSCANAGIRGLGLGLVCLFLVAQSWQLPRLLEHGFRDENWTQVISVLNRQTDALPIFLAANVIEDRDAILNTDDRFQRYLQFPVRGYPAVDANRTVIPIPTHQTFFQPQHLDQMVQQRGGWLVVRIDPDQQHDIAAEIRGSLLSNPAAARGRVFIPTFFSKRRSNVLLFHITLEPTGEAD